MKKTIYGIFAFAMALILVPSFASASEVEVTDEASLVSCLAVDGNVCKLTADVEVENLIDILNASTIDLNGHVLSAKSTLSHPGCLITIVHGGSLTIEDSIGTGVLTSGNSGSIYGAIQLTKKGQTDITKTASLVVNGGTIEGAYYAVSGNGNADRINTSIVINDGVLKGLLAESIGIYHPQDGTLTVNGGEISGETGIEMRSGSLTVNGGVIVGTGDPFTVSPNGNGGTTVGVGIAIAQHTTKLDINVTINGGNIKGFAGLYQSNPQGNANIADDITLSINGGKFESINDGTNAIYSENLEGFVKNGEFSVAPSESYLSDDVVAEEEDGVYYVGVAHKVVANTSEHGKYTVDKDEAIVGQLVSIVATPDVDYELDTIKVVGSDGKEVEVNKDSAFVMPDSDVTVTVTFKANKNPDTSDNILTYVMMGFVSLAVIGCVSLKIKKSMN